MEGKFVYEFLKLKRWNKTLILNQFYKMLGINLEISNSFIKNPQKNKKKPTCKKEKVNYLKLDLFLKR